MKSVSWGFLGECLHAWIFNTQTQIRIRIFLIHNDAWDVRARTISLSSPTRPAPSFSFGLRVHCTYFAFKIANPLKPLQNEICINVISILSQRINETSIPFPSNYASKLYENWLSTNILMNTILSIRLFIFET